MMRIPYFILATLAGLPLFVAVQAIARPTTPWWAYLVVATLAVGYSQVLLVLERWRR